MQLWPITVGTHGAGLYPPHFWRENALHRFTKSRAILILISSDLRYSEIYIYRFLEFFESECTFRLFLPRCYRKNLTSVRLLPIQVLVAARDVGGVPPDLLPVTASNALLYGVDCLGQLRPHSSASDGSNSTFPTSPKRFWESGRRDPQHD